MSRSLPPCPECTMTEVVSRDRIWECMTCGHEWPKTQEERSGVNVSEDGQRVVKDAHGTVLTEGDTVVLIKDLKLRNGSGVLKGGTKAKNIRLVEGDHEIDCKIDGARMGLKACYVRKA